LKTPEAVIEKKMRRDGKDKDSFDLNDMEQKLRQQVADKETDFTTME
jgi:hypothetical protein